MDIQEKLAMQEEGVAEEKKPLFVNDTPFTMEIIRRSQKGTKKTAILCLVLGLVSCVASVLIQSAESILIGCAAIYIFMAIVLFFFYRTVTKNNTQAADNAINHFCFYEDEAVCEDFYGGKKKGEQRLSYWQFTKVLRGEDGLLFLQFGAMMWIIESNNFSVGTEEEFLDFLRSNCKAKTVKIRKKNK